MMIQQQNPDRANISAVPEGISRPLWSVMIPTYNCANYLRETLASVLVQDPGLDVMQIEVIDDRSTLDNPAAVVEELGQGRIGFYQQEKNVGHTKNFQTCLERSQGRLIHLLHGDDGVRNGFYRKMQKAFDQHPEIGAAFCRQIWMDEFSHWQHITELEETESGILSNWLERIAVKQRIQTPSIVVRREVYEHLGGFDRRLSWSEDWEMWVRIAANYLVWYEVEPLALYRIHSNSSSGQKVRTGENMQDVRRAIAIFHDYLPEARANHLVRQSRATWALDAIRYTVPQLLAIGDVQAAIIQIQEALKCSCSYRVLKQLPRLTFQISKRWLKKIEPFHFIVLRYFNRGQHHE